MSTAGTGFRKVWSDDMAPDDEGATPDPGDKDGTGASGDATYIRSAPEQLGTRTEQVLGAARHAVHAAEEELGEPRLPVTLVVLAAISIELLGQEPVGGGVHSSGRETLGPWSTSPLASLRVLGATGKPHTGGRLGSWRSLFRVGSSWWVPLDLRPKRL